MPKTKINLDKPLLFLDGEPVYEPKLDGTGRSDNPIILGKILANNLSSMQEGGLKYFHWALDLFKTGILELDATDLVEFKNAVKKTQLNNLMKGRIEEAIADSEKEATSTDAVVFQ